jgi:hypothetical protein
MKIYRYCYNLNKYQLILGGIFVPLVFNCMLSIIFHWLNIGDNELDEEKLRVSVTTFVAMISFGPWVETVFFQYWPLKIGHYLFKNCKYHYCIIMLLFSTVFAALYGG